MTTMTGIIALIVLILDIVALVDVIKSSMEPVQKLIWALVIIIFPVVGMIVYFLVGKKLSVA